MIDNLGANAVYEQVCGIVRPARTSSAYSSLEIVLQGLSPTTDKRMRGTRPLISVPRLGKNGREQKRARREPDMVAKTIDTSERKASERRDLRIVYDASVEGSLNLPSHKESVPRAPESRTLLVVSIITILVLLFASLKLEQAKERKVFHTLDTVPTKTITVCAGDSRWAIASAHPVKGVSTQELVSWLMDENDLSSAVLALGQSLTVPETQGLPDA